MKFSIFFIDLNSLENFQGLDTPRRSALEEFVRSVCHERLWLEFSASWGAQTLEILERMQFQKLKIREFPRSGRSETLRTREIRGVLFVGGSVARVWRVSGRSNTGNSRADEFLKFWIWAGFWPGGAQILEFLERGPFHRSKIREFPVFGRPEGFLVAS